MIVTLQCRWPLISVLLIALSALWIGLTALSGAQTTGGRIPAPQVGFLAPDFTLVDDGGDTHQLSQLTGRPVVINFWASWCPPCREEMPALQAAAGRYAGEGLVVLLVNATHQDSLRAARAFMDEMAIDLPLLVDENGEVNRLYQVRALPTTYFIKPDGTISDRVIGGPLQPAYLASRIEVLLEDQ